ncbi:helix-turn-helix domain-containing protein, partial [Saccharopolyspora kobensis]
MAKESSLTLERGLSLLQAVAESESEAPTISDLAATVGVSRAAVYRLLGPLQSRGLVRREGSKVRLGLGVLWLAGRVLPQLRVAS